MARRAPSSAKRKAPSLGADTRICALHGPEQWLKSRYLQDLRKALDAAHGETETFSFEGNSATLADVLDELRSYALMQHHKIVLVDNADEFLKKEGFRRAMERYAEAPVDHATLVLRSDAWNRGTLDKLIAKVGEVIKCEPLKPAEAKSWLVKRCQAEHGRVIEPPAAALLVDRMGPELMPLDTELAKLSLMVKPNEPIVRGLVEQVVGKSSDEKAWEVQEAVLTGLSSRSAGQAISKVSELVDLAGQAEVLVVYFVADLIRKLNVAVMMKQSGVPDGVIGKELKLWGPRQQLFMDVLRRLDPKTLAAAFDDVLEADRRSKSGLGKPQRNLECFCVRLADTVK
jgi:DNA polymerase III subunit delta